MTRSAEWAASKCYAVLDQYHERCLLRRLQGRKRRRGNPVRVIYATVCLKRMAGGGRVCEACYSKNTIQLHHVDGSWWNYAFENLQFLCVVCHLHAHDGCWSNPPKIIGEGSMAWKQSDIEILDGVVTSIATEQYNMAVSDLIPNKKLSEVCRGISAESVKLFGRGISDNALADAVKNHILRDKSTSYATDVAHTKTRTTSKSPVIFVPLEPTTVMTMENLLDLSRLYNSFHSAGITITFNIKGA